MYHEFKALSLLANILPAPPAIFLLMALLGPQTLQGMANSSLDTLYAPGEQADQQGPRPRQQKDPPLHLDMIGKILQPPMHSPPGQRRRQQESDQHQHQEILRQQSK